MKRSPQRGDKEAKKGAEEKKDITMRGKENENFKKQKAQNTGRKG